MVPIIVAENIYAGVIIDGEHEVAVWHTMGGTPKSRVAGRVIKAITGEVTQSVVWHNFPTARAIAA